MSAAAGMALAALAHAEACDVLVHEGRVELSCRYEPSDELQAAFRRCRGSLIGVLGWAVPLERAVGPCSVVQWRTRGFGVVGAEGRS